MTIAIIGVGIAGAACAAALSQQGQKVVLFDKGRSAGGRMSSKRTEQGYLDLGAQYFTARDVAFAAQCQRWLDCGTLAQWHSRIAVADAGGLHASPDDTLRFIGVPSMQTPVAQLLENLSVQLSCQIDQLHFDGKYWLLSSNGTELGCFSKLVLAVPQQQAEQLLGDVATSDADLSALFASPALLPCWAVNVQLEHSLWPFDGIFVKNDSRISWLARQASKHGRGNDENWLLHFSTAFSLQHLEADTGWIAQQALLALQQLAGRQVQGQVSHCHRWRYAQQNPDYPVRGMVYRPELALGLAGDWLNGGRVENAWLSGSQLAQELML